jgi:type II secretory pathway pseudopilin PulG
MTTIEILVVIAIIAILASLIGGGVILALRKGPEAQTRYDLQQLQVAVEKFKTDFGIYPPSSIRLYPSASLYSSSAVDQASLLYINKLWPNIGNFTNIAWAGPGHPISASGVTLEGDQCLVFFLGGVPRDASGALSSQGFSLNPTNPASLNAASAADMQNRKKYFEFDAGRLFIRPNALNNLFPSYNDFFGIANSRKQPYLFFSSYGRPNGYNTMATGGVIPDASSLSVVPYVQTKAPATVYYNASTFQLISAGADGQFGPGGVWTPANASTYGSTTKGGDDMTNFYDRMMGVTQ